MAAPENKQIAGFLLLSILFLAANNPAAGLLEKAKNLEKKGQLLEARELYGKILKDPKYKNDVKLQREYENLNVKLLFSRISTPESATHIVKEGEGLLDIAKKYHTTMAVLKRSNNLKDEKILSGKKLKVPKGVFSIDVDKSSNSLTLYLDKKPFKHYPVSTGVKNVTPEGRFKIANKLKDPTWYKAGAVIPPGSKENLLGTRWLGFDYPGYGIHGTVDEKSIGHQASSGCVRMLNRDVEELYEVVPLGSKVTIKD